MTAAVFVPVYFRGRVFDYAWVDAEDAPRVLAYRWTLCGGHACAGHRLAQGVPSLHGIAMHRFVLGLGRGEGVIHHVNEDPLDNRRENLKQLPDMLAHGAEPHPRRDARCGIYGQRQPPHEREAALAASVLNSQSRRHFPEKTRRRLQTTGG